MSWLTWILLWWFAGGPLRALVLLLVVLWLVDRAALRVFPSPLRAFRRHRRRAALERLLAVNPHDRRARLELAEAAIERGQPARAVELLKANIEAGDDDTTTLFAMGVACFGAGHAKQGELFLGEAWANEPRYRGGAIELELGRGRLSTGNPAGARDALESFLARSPGSVEARVLLARALDALGEAPAAAARRDEAWREYASSPLFHRRAQRRWAWRARPSRPATYAALTVLLVSGLLWGAATFEAPTPEAAYYDVD